MIITAVDTETTGLDFRQHEIIQFAAIRFFIDHEKENPELNIIDKLDLKFDPKNIGLASPHALKINGYNATSWRGALPIEKHLNSMLSFISSCDFLLGQNLIFDLRFLQRAIVNDARPLFVFPKYCDTKYMADNLVKKGSLKSSSMDRLCEHYEVKTLGRAHTALADCHRTISVWLKLLEETEIEFFSYEEPYEGTRK